MALERLRSVLRRHRRVALDTSVFIYQIEANPRYVELTDAVFRWLEMPERSAVTSTITMTEILVQPYRLGSDQMVDEYYALLTTFPHLEWIAPSLRIADTAARLRAQHRLKAPDALQAATAVESAATAIIGNDPLFERVEGIEVITLDGFA